VKTQVALALTVEDVVREEFADIPIMIEIARCESTFRQFKADGSLLRGIVNSKDVGAFQINEKYHLADSLRLGYNIHILEGNMQMARRLYERNGTRDWNASKPCWGKSVTVKGVLASS